MSQSFSNEELHEQLQSTVALIARCARTGDVPMVRYWYEQYLTIWDDIEAKGVAVTAVPLPPIGLRWFCHEGFEGPRGRVGFSPLFFRYLITSDPKERHLDAK